MMQTAPASVSSLARKAGLAALLALLPQATATFAQDDPSLRTFSSGFKFVEMTGEELFANVCQGCHMPDAAGAAGAGNYPSLVANKKISRRADTRSISWSMAGAACPRSAR